MSVSKIPMKKRMALYLFSKYRNNCKKIHKLNYIFWECTLRCNLNCLHCGSECNKNPAIKDMPQADFLQALDQIKDIVDPNHTMVVLTGGEALMRKDIESVGINLYNRGFPWGLVTNGMLLTRERLHSLVNSGLRSVTVSLDGTETSHNHLRRNENSFRNAYNAIKYLKEVPDLVYDVVTCVYPGNYDELDKIKELLINAGVERWRLFTIFPVGRAKENAELQLSSQKFKGLFDYIVRTRNEGRIKASYGCEGFLGNYENEVRENFFFCKAGISVASVLVDGSISACPDLRENFIQGNIYKDNFRDVWENRYEIYRDRSWTKTGICAECKSYKYCEGNGMHLRNEKNGELLFCHLKRIEEGELK
jgi:radical SAM enzyme (rSAM/lipoprotein system)